MIVNDFLREKEKTIKRTVAWVLFISTSGVLPYRSHGLGRSMGETALEVEVEGTDSDVRPESSVPHSSSSSAPEKAEMAISLPEEADGNPDLPRPDQNPSWFTPKRYGAAPVSSRIYFLCPCLVVPRVSFRIFFFILQDRNRII